MGLHPNIANCQCGTEAKKFYGRCAPFDGYALLNFLGFASMSFVPLVLAVVALTVTLHKMQIARA